MAVSGGIALVGLGSAYLASEAQSDAASQAGQTSQAQLNWEKQKYADQQGYMQPYYDAGLGGMNQLTGAPGEGHYDYADPSIQRPGPNASLQEWISYTAKIRNAEKTWVPGEPTDTSWQNQPEFDYQDDGQVQAYIDELKKKDPNIDVSFEEARAFLKSAGERQTDIPYDQTRGENQLNQLSALDPNLKTGLGGMRGGLEAYKDIDPTLKTGLGGVQGALGDYRGLDPRVNPILDPNDPTYQFQLEQMREGIDKSGASRGLYDSSYTRNALMEGERAITADYVDRQYDRAASERDRRFDQYGNLVGMESGLAGQGFGMEGQQFGQQTGLLGNVYGMESGLTSMGADIEGQQFGQQFGLGSTLFGSSNLLDQGAYSALLGDYGRGSELDFNLVDKWNQQNLLNYSADQDQWGRDLYLTSQIGQLGMDQNQLNYAQGMDQYNMDINQQNFQNQLYTNLAKSGQGAAGSMTSGGAGINSAYTNLANSQLASGQAEAGFYSGLGALPYNTAATGYYMNQLFPQQTTQPNWSGVNDPYMYG